MPCPLTGRRGLGRSGQSRLIRPRGGCGRRGNRRGVSKLEGGRTKTVQAQKGRAGQATAHASGSNLSHGGIEPKNVERGLPQSPPFWPAGFDNAKTAEPKRPDTPLPALSKPYPYGCCACTAPRSFAPGGRWWSLGRSACWWSGRAPGTTGRGQGSPRRGSPRAC